MKLKDFVANSISEIIEGISTSQEKIKDTGAIINPKGDDVNIGSNSVLGRSRIDGKYIPIVEMSFDIMVEVSDSESDKAGISVITGLFGAGAALENKNDNRSINSIKFSVPILFPVNDTSVKLQKKSSLM